MTRYTVVTGDSEVIFRARSTLHPVTAGVQPSGWLEAEVAEGAFASTAITGHLELPVTELRSNTPMLDREARRRLDAKRHEYVTADINDVVAVDGASATITGTITVRGIEELVEGRISLSATPTGDLLLEGDGTLDMRWWALEPPRLLMLSVDPEFEVAIRLVLLAE